MAENKAFAMNTSSNDNLVRLLKLTQEMLALADEGDRDRTDDACGIIYGVLRDSAYRLRNMAADECRRHQSLGKWTPRELDRTT